MKKIAEFLSKWAFAIVLGVLGVGLLCALGCSIYTAIEGNALVGAIGAFINIVGLCYDGALIWLEIREG